MTLRIVVVLALVALFAVAPALHRRRQRRLQVGPAHHPTVPEFLRSGADRTWVLFTTPWCASCAPVEERLRASDPGAEVVRVDATRRPDVARAFAVRSAPTVLLVSAEGTIEARLVGADAIDRYLSVSAG